jgi:hypothetical protein
MVMSAFFNALVSLAKYTADADTELPAAIRVGKRANIIVAGFPFECIITDEQRMLLMKKMLE